VGREVLVEELTTSVALDLGGSALLSVVPVRQFQHVMDGGL